MILVRNEQDLLPAVLAEEGTTLQSAFQRGRGLHFEHYTLRRNALLQRELLHDLCFRWRICTNTPGEEQRCRITTLE